MTAYRRQLKKVRQVNVKRKNRVTAKAEAAELKKKEEERIKAKTAEHK